MARTTRHQGLIRRGHPTLCAAAALAVTAWVGGARGAPQVSAGATFAGGVTDLRTEGRARAAFQLGLRGDLLWGRSKDRDFGLGPYANVATTAFATFEAGGGLEALLPLTEVLPVEVSAGSFVRTGPTPAWQPGLEAALFVGSHGFNYHSPYALTAGLFVQGRYGLSDLHQADLMAGAIIDLELLALPFLLAYEALR